MPSHNFARLNDGTAHAPRLRVQHSLWSLNKLPLNAATEWTLDEKFERVAAHGFAGVECWLTDEKEREHADALARHGLRLTLGHRPYQLETVQKEVARAKRLGADFIFAQPADAFTSLETVAALCRDGAKIANDNGLPLFVETHRGNFTETLPQILQLIEAVPDIRFTGDLSHLVLVGEFYGWADERATERLMPVLSRVSHLHGRVSSGEQVQVDVGDGKEHTAARFFVRLWATVMREWLKNAGPGDIFPFGSELGPPRYAITLPDGSEFSDRWTQSLVMKELAEEAWAIASDPNVTL